MSSGKSSIFPSGEISVRVAAQRKNVSVATVYYWIKSGKLSAKKVGRSYYIATDELFEKIHKNHKGDNYKDLEEENWRLRRELWETKRFCNDLSIAYDQALERAEDLHKEVSKWRLYGLVERSPDLLMKIYREYNDKLAGKTTQQWQYQEAWEYDANEEELELSSEGE